MSGTGTECANANSEDEYCQSCQMYRVTNDDIHLTCPSCADSVTIYTLVPERTYDLSDISVYDSSSHLDMWIERVQGVEKVTIPNRVITKVREAKSEDLASVRECLKENGFSNYYDNSAKILWLSNDIRPPQMSDQMKGDIRTLFSMIQEPYKLYSSNKNLPSYNYILYKICQLLGYDDFLPQFRLFKTKKILKGHDLVWSQVCSHLGWPYHDTPYP